MATTTSTLDRKALGVTPGFLAWLGLLGLCLTIGLISALQVFIHGLVLTNMSDQVPWGLWITIDLSSIALGAGAFTLSAVVYIFRIKRFHSMIRLAVFVGFIGYTSALLTLIMDIGRPDRFWHPWFYWNIHSVLWEITWCISIYLTIMVVEFAPVIAEASFFDRWPWVRAFASLLHKMAPVLAILGLMISLLHQSSLGATYGIVKSRPIWFKPSMPIMFILSAVAVGPALSASVAIVLEWLTGKKSVPKDTLRLIYRFSAFTLLAYAYIKFWDLAAVSYYGRTPGVSESLFILNTQTPYNFGFWFGEVFIGIVIPVIIFLVPRYNRKPTLLVFGGLCAVLGILFNRWNVTVSGLFVPLQFSPGVLYQIPPGEYWPALVEWGVAIGIIGYALTLMTIGAKYLPLFPSDESHS
jgi:molybdopterin-containing oxidoreductase family membrane subunit